MKNLPTRKAFALANWKMAMDISESLAFAREFPAVIGSLAQSVDIVLCPPYTALYALSRVLTDTPIDLGAQNLHAGTGKAHTGEISAMLLADAGCRWVMLGHWEIRRRTGERDVDFNKKMRVGFQAGLRPILLMGEGNKEQGEAEAVLASRLPILFDHCEPGQVAQGVIVYEPEWTIGAQKPAPPDYIATSCAFIRNWIGQAFGKDVAQQMRIIYGGSVAPEHVENLLASPDLDGLGAGRKGRDPFAFAQIVRLIAAAKGLTP
ncbi:MAG: triose-phosphate isomerase [Deltaproteobacteria bacterium]|nr:MAG: triose-phosphate isomerase [Deltaproteobacteria bacterium]